MIITIMIIIFLSRLECVVGSKQEHAHYEILSLPQILFFVSVKCHQDHMTLT